MLQALFINKSVLWLEKMVESELHLAGVFLNPVLLWVPNYQKNDNRLDRHSGFVGSAHSGNIFSTSLLA